VARALLVNPWTAAHTQQPSGVHTAAIRRLATRRGGPHQVAGIALLVRMGAFPQSVACAHIRPAHVAIASTSTWCEREWGQSCCTQKRLCTRQRHRHVRTAAPAALVCAARATSVSAPAAKRTSTELAPPFNVVITGSTKGTRESLGVPHGPDGRRHPTLQTPSPPLRPLTAHKRQALARRWQRSSSAPETRLSCAPGAVRCALPFVHLSPRCQGAGHHAGSEDQALPAVTDCCPLAPRGRRQGERDGAGAGRAGKVAAAGRRQGPPAVHSCCTRLGLLDARHATSDGA